VSRMYAAMQDELLVIGRSNGHWHAERRLEGASTQCVAIDPLRPERVYCGTFDRGLWRSLDAGASWEHLGEGVVRKAVMSVAVGGAERAGEHGVVYVGTEPSAVYRSEDGGDSWRELEGLGELPSAPEWSFPPRPETSHVRWISLDPNAPGRVFVAIEAGALVRTPDAGRTWVDRTPDGPRDTHTLATHQDVPGRLYSAAGDGFMRAGMGYAESQDAGDTWERSGEGLEHHYLWGVAVDPADPETVVVSAATSPWEAHDPARAKSTIYRKQAGGTWQEVTEGLPETEGRVVSILASHEAEPGVFYALTNLGLYRSPDAGRSWKRLDIAWPDHYRRQHQNALAIVGAD
jgi:photosystem II stability/assembly factor-like uncharacterized protein